MRRSRTRGAALALTMVLATAACGDGPEATTDSTEAGNTGSGGDVAQQEGADDGGQGGDSDEVGSEQRYPDIVEVDVERLDDRSASFSVTVSSPYDTPERYADGWRVLDQDGNVLGEHTLAHDHAAEQPFTRRQSDVSIPEGTTELTIEGRDQANGYGGETVTLDW